MSWSRKSSRNACLNACAFAGATLLLHSPAAGEAAVELRAASIRSIEEFAEFDFKEQTVIVDDSILLGAIDNIPRFDFQQEMELSSDESESNRPDRTPQLSQFEAIIAFDLGQEQTIDLEAMTRQSLLQHRSSGSLIQTKSLTLTTSEEDSTDALEAILQRSRQESSAAVSLAGGLLLHESSTMRVDFGVTPPDPEMPSEWGMVMRVRFEF